MVKAPHRPPERVILAFQGRAQRSFKGLYGHLVVIHAYMGLLGIEEALSGSLYPSIM